MTTPQVFAQAIQHHQAGRLKEAEALYRQILAAQPNHAEALHHLGVIAHQIGRHDLAVEWIGRAVTLDPKNPAAHCNLGEAHRALGHFDEAAVAYRRALELNPVFPAAHNNLGIVLRERGQLDEAVAAFRRALELKPSYVEAHNNLGATLIARGQSDEAVAACRRALELQPDNPQAHINLGAALVAHRESGEAMAACHRALELQPDSAGAYSNLGAALKDEGRLDEAVAACCRALELQPNDPEAHVNLGLTRFAQGLFEEAITAYRLAITRRADSAHAHFNLSLPLLLLGRYEEGWHEYEWRERIPTHARYARHFSVPLWDGMPAAGKTILIHAEQGLGDTLHFARYLPFVRELSQAARIVLECQPALVPLLKQLRGADLDIIARSAADKDLRPFDLHIPLLSLPLVLRSFEPVAVSAPYLHADPNLRERWRERLGSDRALCVGLAWRGSAANPGDRGRSIAPEKLSPILSLPGIRFFSLQVEPRQPLPANLADHGILDFTADITNFSDSAALIAELDLIITVDTATAHLAGALGRPVWVLLPFAPDWRWGLHREDTPWYPTMRLFRQTTPGDWDSVMQNVVRELSRPQALFTP